MFFTIKQLRIYAARLGTVMMFCAIAAAEQPTVSLDELIAQLAQNNLQIQAAENGYQASLARPSQARTLPDPLVAFVSKNSNGNPLPFTELGKDPLSSVGFMWEQEFPYPGKLKLAGKIAEKETVAMGAEVDLTKWAMIAQLKQVYYEYFRTDRSLDVLNESMDLLKRFEEIAEARYRVGEGIQQDVLRAQLEISILSQRTTRLEQERASAIADINRLLNRSIDSPLPKPDAITESTLAISVEKLQQEYSLLAPMIRSREALMEREQVNVELAKKQYRPDFITSAEYGYSPNFPDMWEFQVGLRIPIFFKKKQSYGVTEATRNLGRAEKELATNKQEVAFNIKNEYLQIQASEKLLALYGEAIIPQSNLSLESSIASYQVGKADFLTILSNFLTLLEYRTNYFEELTKHESAIARLEQAVGRSLASTDLTGGRKP
jgi:outer membrane protein, heavy metal efflux system